VGIEHVLHLTGPGQGVDPTCPPAIRRRWCRRFMALAAGVGLALGAPACSGDDDASRPYGPLVVVRTSERHAVGGPDPSEFSGTLRIREKCVILELVNGRERLLVWYEPDVVWNPDTRSIRFHAGGGTFREPLELRDGDQIAIGVNLNPRPNLSPGEESDLIQPPDSSCPDDPRPIVIAKMSGGRLIDES